jgi:anti-sigma regulatory factor (Ser/Thr protein kinase)
MPSRTFPAWADSVPLARRYVSETLDRVPPELCQTAALLVSELATNVVRHSGAGEFVVELENSPDQGLLWVGVTDSGSGLPILRAPSLTAEHGRGMRLVATLADRWGAGRRRGATDKTVWFELRYPSTAALA